MRRLFLGLVPAVPLLVVLPLACSSAEVSRIGLVMRTPQGLLDEATSVTLWVFPAEQASCDANGHVSRIPEGDETQQFGLERAGCPAGVKWCKDIELEQSSDEKMFAVVAQGAGVILAEGCTAMAVDQDPLEVTLEVQRYNPPPCCGDGVLQRGEQCDAGLAPAACGGQPAGQCQGTHADEVCGCDCLANEILLSINNTHEPDDLTAGPPGSKTQLSMAFVPGVGVAANTLRAVFRNSDPETSKQADDINIRFLTEDMVTVAESVPLSQQLRLPLDCGLLAGDGETSTQHSPSIAQIGADMAGVVYASDKNVGGTFEAWLVAHSPEGCRQPCTPGDTACLARFTPVQLSFSGGPPGVQDPDLAGGPPSAALAVWSRGRVLGRIWRTTGELVPDAAEIEIAHAGTRPRVAGTSTGWTVVYQGGGSGDGDGIFLRRVNLNGDVEAEIRVNSRTDGLQEQPDIAQLPDGRMIVVWRSAGDIYFQRFDEAGMPMAGDQDAPLNTTTAGEQRSPVVTAAGVLGDFYVAAWEHQDGSKIYARYPAASGGFRYNSVTGQNDDFEASHPKIAGLRRLPAVAVGGGGWVAIGWQDEREDAPGVYARRFPLPSQ